MPINLPRGGACSHQQGKCAETRIVLAESRNTSRAIKRAFKDVWLGGIRVARVRDRVRDRIRERSC